MLTAQYERQTTLLGRMGMLVEVGVRDSSHYRAVSKIINDQHAILRRVGLALLLTCKRVRGTSSQCPVPPPFEELRDEVKRRHAVG